MARFGFGQVENRPDPRELKDIVDMHDVVEQFLDINSAGKAECIAHDDSDPSMHVYENGVHCFACGFNEDVYGFLVTLHKKSDPEFSFSDAVSWLEKFVGGLPTSQYRERNEKTKQVLTLPKRKPVPSNWVQHWHKNIDGNEEWLVEERLLNQQLIEKNMLGWRRDITAYSIPFFVGLPSISDVDVVQYRSYPGANKWRYRGETGYGHPSILGRHLINDWFCVMLFGTLDQQLAEQDGIPAIAPNNINAFAKRDKAEAVWLRNKLKGVKNLFVVPDATPQEFETAHKIANIIGGQVRYFRKDTWGKDYTDWRKSGRSVDDFYREVLKLDDYRYLSDEQKKQLDLVFKAMAGGDKFASNALAKFAKTMPTPEWTRFFIWHFIQTWGPVVPENYNTFRRREWEDFADLVSNMSSQAEIAFAVADMADAAHRKLGGF